MRNNKGGKSRKEKSGTGTDSGKGGRFSRSQRAIPNAVIVSTASNRIEKIA
jgi:hypothetical protein